MKTILNVIWFVLSGVWLFLGYLIAGVICCILIVTIPWGIASFRLANYAAWPFGREVINKPRSGCLTLIGNIIWLIVAGWWMALLHVITGVLLCITIIGIPLGVANFKMIGICLVPLGKEIVPKGQA
ncbi:YccF domain-containing protein [Microlunatus speluncae]|uniref:YccF domain-containing protein n=1 Tax=Microlunatus speluncae TaxID=2594267 RepID=UPI0012663E7C|nr:YccF domain-containing protein [Microlunatus speluncae]